MPVMNGLEFMRRLRTYPHLRDIPVAFLTSSGHEQDKTEALRLGARFYLRKPSNLDDYSGIVSAIREMMAARVQ
jgi:CheY-like chemotaxis protein